MSKDNTTQTDSQDNDENSHYETMDYSCEYSDNLPKILKQLNISLAFTSYQAGRLMFLRSDGDTLDVNFKSFHRPMGLSANKEGMTLGVFSEIINFQREDGLLKQIKLPQQRIEEDITAPRIKAKKTSDSDFKKNKKITLTENELEQQQKFKEQQQKLNEAVDKRVDACFITRSSHYSGMINIHDIDWGNEGLWVVNSSFSCLCTVEADYSFTPRWKPYFISELVPEDRCHLNGMALKDGQPAYVTTFSKFNEVGMWRKNKHFDGTLMDVKQNKILVDGLAMPHSPRWHQESVYFCNSGYGQVCTYQPKTKKSKTIAELPGFTRGMDFYGALLFVGLSKVRKSDVTQSAPLIEKHKETLSGIYILNTEDNSVVAHITFTGNVDQIYDVAVIPDCHFPELIEPTHPRIRNHFCHPELKSI